MLIRGWSTRVSQPTGPVEIDWANPLSAGLALDSRGDLFFREGAAGRVPSQSVGQLTRQATPFGVAAGLASAVTSFGDVELFTGSQVAFQVFEIPNNLTQVAGLVNKRSSSNSQNSFSFGYNYNAANEFTVDIGDGAGTSVGTNYRFSTSTFSTAGNNLIILIDGQAGTGQKIRVFRNGVAALNVLNNADNTFSAFTNTTAPLEIGRVNNATLYYAGRILLVRAWNRLLTPDEVSTLSDNPWQLYRPAERRVWLSDVGGGGASQTVAFTLEDVSAAVSQTLSHSQNLTGTLDGIAFAASQTLSHAQSLAATLDDVTVNISQTLGNATSQALAITLDGVTVAASQTLSHAQSLTATLDGVTFTGSQTLSHSQALAATLEGITVEISQSAAPSSKDQSLAVTLDSIAVSIAQEGPANLIDTHDGFWAKEWARIRAREKRKYREEIEERVEEIQDEIAEVEQQIVEVKQAPKPKKSTPARNFYAEQSRIVEHLIARRNQLIDEEDEELLLLL